MGLVLLNEDGKLHELIHLGLGVLHVLVLSRKDASNDLVGFLLSVKSLSVVTELEVSMGDGLVATCHLNVIFAKEVDVSIETLHEAINGSLELFEVLVHQAQVEVDGGDVRVVLTSRDFEDG